MVDYTFNLNGVEINPSVIKHGTDTVTELKEGSTTIWKPSIKNTGGEYTYPIAYTNECYDSSVDHPTGSSNAWNPSTTQCAIGPYIPGSGAHNFHANSRGNPVKSYTFLKDVEKDALLVSYAPYFGRHHNYEVFRLVSPETAGTFPSVGAYPNKDAIGNICWRNSAHNSNSYGANTDPYSTVSNAGNSGDGTSDYATFVSRPVQSGNTQRFTDDPSASTGSYDLMTWKLGNFHAGDTLELWAVSSGTDNGGHSWSGWRNLKIFTNDSNWSA